MCRDADGIARRDRPVDTAAGRGRIEKAAGRGDDRKLPKQGKGRAGAVPTGLEILSIGVVLAIRLVMKVRAARKIFALYAVDPWSPVFLIAHIAIKNELRNRRTRGRVGRNG